MGLGLKKLGKVAGAAAAGNPVGAVSALSEKKPPTPAEIVLKALESEEVQEAIRSLGTVTAQVDIHPGREREKPQPEMPDILHMDFLNRVKQHEGYNPVPHEVFGVWHVGYGHNIVANHPIAWQEIIDEGRQTEEQCEEWLEEDIQAAEGRLEGTCRHYGVDPEDLPMPVREGLVEMAFQLGTTRKWKQMWTAIRNGDYAGAANLALRSGIDPRNPSIWMKQTPQRALDVAHFLSNRTYWFERNTAMSTGYLEHKL